MLGWDCVSRSVKDNRSLYSRFPFSARKPILGWHTKNLRNHFVEAVIINRPKSKSALKRLPPRFFPWVSWNYHIPQNYPISQIIPYLKIIPFYKNILFLKIIPLLETIPFLKTIPFYKNILFSKSQQFTSSFHPSRYCWIYNYKLYFFIFLTASSVSYRIRI